jgi:branched-chain amino acid transport system substrate-binding protein
VSRSWVYRLLVLLVCALVAAACGGDGDEGDAASESTPTVQAEEPSKCGSGEAGAASGEPIRVGAVVTNGAGVDFSSATKGAAAYFECVNANGGIGGRPIEYTVENDELNPEKAGQAAAKLVQQEKVDAIVGSTSFVDCAVNAQTYDQAGYKIVYGVGVPEPCFKSPAITPVNMGPQLSGVGAAQYAVEHLGAKKLVGVAPNIPGVGTYTNDGIEAYAKEAGVEFESVINDIPIKDPQSVATQVAQKAGKDGAVVLVMPVPEDIAVLKAAETAGVAETTKWTCATPCNDLSFPEAVGDFWKDKVWTNSELNLTDSPGADNQLWLKVMDEYADEGDPRDNFSQAGSWRRRSSPTRSSSSIPRRSPRRRSPRRSRRSRTTRATCCARRGTGRRRARITTRTTPTAPWCSATASRSRPTTAAASTSSSRTRPPCGRSSRSRG